ncbi:MAG TPA: hypothetical protein VF933_09235 [Streptosporangiaceae bacterium]
MPGRRHGCQTHLALEFRAEEVFSVISVADVVDLDRYPVDRLDSPAGQDLVARCRRELAIAGASVLDGFIRPAAVASVVDWAMTAMPKAYRTEAEHNVYFTDADPGLPVGDPHRIRVRSAKGALTYDQIPPGSPLRVAYESAGLTAFVGAAVGRDVLYRHADKLGALNVMCYSHGDEHGWHFDQADFVVTLMLQAPLAGGQFEYVPMLRSADDENQQGVRRLLQGDRSGVRAMSGAAGTLTLFRGHLSPHHVTAVTGSLPRINAVLSYATAPGAQLSDHTKQLFYGRTS